MKKILFFVGMVCVAATAVFGQALQQPFGLVTKHFGGVPNTAALASSVPSKCTTNPSDGTVRLSLTILNTNSVPVQIWTTFGGVTNPVAIIGPVNVAVGTTNVVISTPRYEVRYPLVDSSDYYSSSTATQGLIVDESWGTTQPGGKPTR